MVDGIRPCGTSLGMAAEGKKRGPGRPSTYTRKRGRRVSRRIAKSRHGLVWLHNKYRPDFPQPHTIIRWRESHEDFARMYDIAKQTQAERYAAEHMGMVKEVYDLALDHVNVRSFDEQEGKALGVLVKAAQLKAAAIKWHAGRLSPKDYGHKVEIDAKVEHKEASVARLESELAALAAKQAKGKRTKRA